MNDKNFIEELRQKREEYGVTQTRLAVACGISREYVINVKANLFSVTMMFLKQSRTDLMFITNRQSR